MLRVGRLTFHDMLKRGTLLYFGSQGTSCEAQAHLAGVAESRTVPRRRTPGGRPRGTADGSFGISYVQFESAVHAYAILLPGADRFNDTRLIATTTAEDEAAVAAVMAPLERREVGITAIACIYGIILYPLAPFG